MIDGSAHTESFDVVKGDAVFARLDCVDIHVGTTGMVGLLAYTEGGLVPDLMQCPRWPAAEDARTTGEVQGPTSFAGAMA